MGGYSCPHTHFLELLSRSVELGRTSLPCSHSPSWLLSAESHGWGNACVNPNLILYLLCSFLASVWVINNDYAERSVAELSAWLGSGTALAAAGGQGGDWESLGRGAFLLCFSLGGGVVALTIAAREKLEGV